MLRGKSTVALVDYAICNSLKCAPDSGICAAVRACTHRVIKQIDGIFEPPAVFQDLCQGCGDCTKACPLGAIDMKYIV